ncbi:MAG: hypothetical protein M3375_02260 [Actinomycetota bacterium]|nr:hypothetical protein [Actinomycetota bacterium]
MDPDARHRRRQEARLRTRRRRGAVALGGVLAFGLLVLAVAIGGRGASPGEGRDRGEAQRPAKPAELPRGGRSILPENRVVAFYGAPQSEELGVLGIGSPARAGKRLERQARVYSRPRRPALPAFELISTVVQRSPGDDGDYAEPQKPAVIDRYLREARRRKMLLILDIQPGRSPFMREVRGLRRWLEQPDVSLALDPEWSMGPGEIPGRSIGSTDARTVNEVSAYLSRIVRERKLPQKILLVHRFTKSMIEDERALRRDPGVALTVNVDGFGTQAQKRAKYRELTRGRRGRHDGFKLFFREDTRLMSPRQTLRMRPSPDVVTYE